MVPYFRTKEGWVSDICGCEGGVSDVGVREGWVSNMCGCEGGVSDMWV